MSSRKDYSAKFSDLTFEDFKRFAADKHMSKYGKIGFPDSYRKDKEENIFFDIIEKLPCLKEQGKTIVDIGPGCSDLPEMMINFCKKQQHKLVLIDSAEMLALLPDGDSITKISACFPDCPQFLQEFYGKVDGILTYSVLQYAFADSFFWQFIDSGVKLLNEGGRFLLGDIPNISKRKRFFDSESGKAFHRAFTRTDNDPTVQFNVLEQNQIDDGVLLGVVSRYRLAGYDTYILPQAGGTAMANRREDLLICRP